jgi:hypothetical protein
MGWRRPWTAHREVLLTLDDILLEDGKVAPFSHHEPTIAMGCFGTRLLIAGEPELTLNAKLGELSASTSRTLRTRGCSGWE